MEEQLSKGKAAIRGKMSGNGKLVRLFHTEEPESLIIVVRNQEGKIYSIGRQQRKVTQTGMEVIVCTSEFVSRHHCDVTFRNGAFWIRDNQSLNGTYLNGQKIAPRVDRELRFGDVVGLGVSNLATDVDIQSQDYFLFRFQAETVPVIHIDDDDDEEEMVVLETASKVKPENRVGPSPPIAIVEPQRSIASVQQNEESSSDVEIIDLEEDESPAVIPESNDSASISPHKPKPEVKSNEVASSSPPKPIIPESNKSGTSSPKHQQSKRVISESSDSPSSSPRRERNQPKPVVIPKSAEVSGNSPKKPVPPPPPPPVWSKKKDVTTRVGPASFKRKLAEQEKEKIDKSNSAASSVSVNTSRQEKVDSRVRSDKQQPSKSKQRSERFKNELKRKRHIISSSDDSSNGLPHNEGNFVPNPDFNPDVDEFKELKQETKYAERSEDDDEQLQESETTKDGSSKPISSQSLKDEILGGRRILRVILKQCVNEKGGVVHIRKKCKSKISPADLDKILRQYHESENRIIQKGLETEEVSVVSGTNNSSEFDSDSDIFEQVVINKKPKQATPRKEAKKRRHADEESSDVSSYMNDSDNENKQSHKKKKKLSDEKQSHKKNETKRDSQKDKSKPKRDNPKDKTKPLYASHYSPSNAEPRPGCSKDLYSSVAFQQKRNQDSASDDQMDYSDGEGYRSENEKVESDEKSGRREVNEDTNKGRRTLKMLDHAPVPRQFRKLNEKSKPVNKIPAESFYNQQRSPLSRHLSAEEAKKSRQEKLHQIGANKRAEEERQKKFQSVPKSAPAPVRAKIQSRNRNQQLFDDLLNSATKDPKEKDAEKPAPVKEVVKNIPAPKREIPLPAISPSKMPVNLITREMERSKLEHENRTRPAPPVNPPPAARAPVSSRNVMEKEGSSLARAANPVESSHKTIINYYHGQAEPVTVSAPKTQEPGHFELPEDEAFLTISRWNPSWLHEEQNHSTPPPLFADKNKDGIGCSLTRTRYNYDTYKSYLDVMFPLLMFEIWATIGSEYFGTRKGDSPAHSSASDELNEYPFVVEKVVKEQFCPMISSRKQCKDHNWVTLSCYTLEPHDKKINWKKDLAIVKLPIENPAKGGKPKEREFFGWVVFKSQIRVPIEGKVHDDLNRQVPNAKSKITFDIVISSPVKILRHRIAHMRRVCYISSKLRDFKAMCYLRVSGLFPKIINLQPPSHLFDSNARVPNHHLVSYVSKLNPIQKSAVAYVAERVSSPGPELMLLHGAPGVGKSRTIVGMILQILSKIGNQPNPKKILVCTPSNTAIDELMRRIDEALDELPNKKFVKMIRIGDTGGLCPKLKNYYLDTVARQKVDMSSTSNIQKEIDQANRELEDKKLEIEIAVKNKGSKTTIESLRRELEETRKRRDDFLKDLETKKKSIKDGDFHKAKLKAIREATIICSTLTTCSNSVLTGEFGFSSRTSGKSFSCCIIDEATQATEPETLNPLLLQVDKMILVGDPCQLGATVVSSYAAEKGYDMSLFSRLHHYYTVQLKIPNAVMMLTQQYRMHPEILAWPNDAFYKGCLKTTIIGRSSDDACPLTPYIFLNLSGRESKVNGQISNELEIKLVLEVVRNIHLTTTAVISSDRRWSMGVITPYKDQKGKIRDAIKRELKAVADQVEVDTVDSFQGREKDVIIISCVRTEGTGFLNSKLRLNVALTRAKHSLIVIGDAECLKRESMWSDLIDNARSRGRIFDIQESSILNSQHLTKRLFGALSPSKSVVNNDS